MSGVSSVLTYKSCMIIKCGVFVAWVSKMSRNGKSFDCS